ncbi:hypothetical protein N836_34025 [Leptolyngbya sp. Heron Island J]|uniref:hypothetical protein n=1 Tax=Leptolyngbya sp. Heron Island J TaxID=1385935 RepID=UPI0003B9A80E|nr:hypothetical protein [Leptolyngbya sp. Heron Island J]ESA38097.1 hypothetical protein N836_34025 [Leptolyngbya sp. Heron Island J]
MIRRVNGDNFFQVAGGLVLTAVGGIIVITSLNPDVQSQQEHAAQVKQLQVSQEREAQLAELERYKANERYLNRCSLLKSSQISASLQVKNVPLNTPVCDLYGNTALPTADGTLTDIARTPDQDVIQQRVSR